MATRPQDLAANIDVRPLGGNIGAVISGADLSQPLDDDSFAVIHQALLDYLVIFFRDQAIRPEDQIAFGKRFGELHIHPYIPNLDGYPEVILLQSADDGPGQMAYQSNAWHTDLTYTAEPSMASILRAVDVPEAGGDTMWNNLYLAYEGLSTQMRSFVDTLTAIHYIGVTMPPDFLEQSWAPKQIERFLETTPPIEHPVVTTHPETGRKCLYVNRHFTSHIKGLSRHESGALLNCLYEHIEQPEFSVRFHWENNSIAVWDNRCTQHYALVDYRSRRTMHRVTIKGSRPPSIAHRHTGCGPAADQ